MKKLIKSVWENSNIWMAISSILILLTMLIPYLYVAQYVWPSSDDFELSIWTKQAWMASGSLWQVLEQALAFTYYKYMGWQGAYSSIFLMALQPGIWGDQYYPIGVVFIILGFVISFFVLTYMLIIRLGNASKSIWIIISSIILWYYLIYLMYPEEAFYWWTGASYYTGFFSWAMLLLSMLIQYYLRWQSYTKMKKIMYSIFTILFSLFIGGGNFPTTLLLIEVVFFIILIAIYKKKKCRNIMLMTFISLVVALLISVLAPGNINHMEEDISVSAVEAIVIAIQSGLQDIRYWTSIPIIVMMLLLLPFFIQIVEASKQSFKYPVVFTILSGGLYLSMYTPITYTYGRNVAPGRMINLFYFSLFILLSVNVYYWTGWIYTKYIKDNIDIRSTRNKFQSLYLLCIGILFVGSLTYMGIQNTNLYKFYQEYNNDEYRLADEFLQERADYLALHQGEDVLVDYLPYKPSVSYFSDITSDPNHLLNKAVAEYYGVNSISYQK